MKRTISAIQVQNLLVETGGRVTPVYQMLDQNNQPVGSPASAGGFEKETKLLGFERIPLIVPARVISITP